MRYWKEDISIVNTLKQMSKEKITCNEIDFAGNNTMNRIVHKIALYFQRNYLKGSISIWQRRVDLMLQSHSGYQPKSKIF